MDLSRDRHTIQTECRLSQKARVALKYGIVNLYGGSPGGSDSKESTYNAGDLGSIPGLGRSSGGGHGNPFQYSCLENSRDRGPWQATVHEAAKSWIQ